MDDVWCATNYTKKEIQNRDEKKKRILAPALRVRVCLIRLQITGHVLSKQWELGATQWLR